MEEVTGSGLEGEAGGGIPVKVGEGGAVVEDDGAEDEAALDVGDSVAGFWEGNWNPDPAPALEDVGAPDDALDTVLVVVVDGVIAGCPEGATAEDDDDCVDTGDVEPLIGVEPLAATVGVIVVYWVVVTTTTGGEASDEDPTDDIDEDKAEVLAFGCRDATVDACEGVMVVNCVSVTKTTLPVTVDEVVPEEGLIGAVELRGLFGDPAEEFDGRGTIVG